VPPAERSPEVAAFVESVQLMLDIAELLPLMPDGNPVLPDTPATRQQAGWPPQHGSPLPPPSLVPVWRAYMHLTSTDIL
jgi:hypothetical protein